MKNILLYLLLLLAATRTTAQTEFAPLGAEWYYGSINPYNEIFYENFWSEKDTVLQGQSCRKVSGLYVPKHGYRKAIAPDFYYTSGDTVLRYAEVFNKFVPIYIFNVNKGDTLTLYNPYYMPGNDNFENDSLFRVHVDSVTLIVVEGQSLRSVWTSPAGSGFRFERNYIERIGSTFSTQEPTYHPGIPEFYERSFRCYKDQVIQLQHTTPCDTLPGGSSDIEKVQSAQDQRIRIYPNPSRGNFILEPGSSQPDKGIINLFDIQGRHIQQWRSTNRLEQQASYSIVLPPGMYILRWKEEGKECTQKLIVQP